MLRVEIDHKCFQLEEVEQRIEQIRVTVIGPSRQARVSSRGVIDGDHRA